MKMNFKFALGVVLSASPFFSSASQPGAGSELEGNSAEALRSDGSRAVIFFKPGHQVDFDVAMGDRPAHYHGRYSVQDGQLCFEIKGDRDCWHYTGAFQIDHPKQLSAAGEGRMTAVYTLRPGTSGRMPAAVKQ